MNQTSVNPPLVLFFSRDIFFAPAVKMAAQQAACQFSIIGSMQQVSALDGQNVRACVVDLTPLSLEEIVQWGELLKSHFPCARCIAFGPHVQTEHFAAAAQAGFDPVLAKGQVAHLLPKLL